MFMIRYAKFRTATMLVSMASLLTHARADEPIVSAPGPSLQATKTAPSLLVSAFREGVHDGPLTQAVRQIVSEAGLQPKNVDPSGEPALPSVSQSACHGVLACLLPALGEAVGSIEVEMNCSTKPRFDIWMVSSRGGSNGEGPRLRQMVCQPVNKQGAFSADQKRRLSPLLIAWYEANREVLGGRAGSAVDPKLGETLLTRPADPAGQGGGATESPETPPPSEKVVVRPRVTRGPFFQAGVALAIIGGVTLIPAGLLSWKAGSPAGSCSINGTQPLNGPDCVIPAWPGPVLFAAGGAIAATGVGFLIYWGAKIKNQPTTVGDNKHAQ